MSFKKILKFVGVSGKLDTVRIGLLAVTDSRRPYAVSDTV